MSQPVQKFLVGERVVWRTPAIDARQRIEERSDLFVRATICKVHCRFPRSPDLAVIVYTLLLDREVWSEKMWSTVRVEDLYRRMPKGGKLWTRALAVKKKRKKKAKP